MGIAARSAAAMGLGLTLSLAPLAAIGLPIVRAAEPLLTTTQLSAPYLDPKPVGRPTSIVATVTADATGDVKFFVDDVEAATVALSGTMAVYDLPADMPLGTHQIRASYQGDGIYAPSDSASVPVQVGPRPVSIELKVSGPHDQFGATAQQGDVVYASVWATDAGATGHLTVFDGTVAVAVDGVTKATFPLADQSAALDTTTWSIGSHSVVASYDPGTGQDFSAGASAPFSISIVPNVVEALGLAASHPVFYPVKDGYLDTTTLRGLRDEPASVVIRVYSPVGKLVKSASVGMAAGNWNVAWNGRNSAGVLLPAGRYTVKQTATDARGAKATFVSYVTLSLKRLYTYSATYTKQYSLAARRTSTWIAWAFTLPSAGVYKSLVFSMYGRDIAADGGFGPQDFTACGTSSWMPACVARWRTFPTSYAWRSVSGSPTADRSGRTVRLYAWGGAGDTRVVDGRVRVVYGFLR